jgi:uncharacterized protein YqeY
MSIKDMLNQDMKAALKAGEKDRLSVIRMAKSAIFTQKKKSFMNSMMKKSLKFCLEK